MPIYRLIMQTAPGRVDTGASYPACSRTNPGGCMPAQFEDIQTAINYAAANGEVPNIVASADEAWAFIDALQPQQVSLPPVASIPVSPDDILRSWKPQDFIPSTTPPPMGGAGTMPAETPYVYGGDVGGGEAQSQPQGYSELIMPALVIGGLFLFMKGKR